AVFLDRSPRVDGGRRLCAYSDSTAVAECAARELLRFGWNHTAFVPCADPNRIWCEERERVFVSVMRRNGCETHVFSPDVDRSDDRAFLGALGKWIADLPLPCTLFAANDLIGRQVLSLARQNGIGVPQQLAVVAVDNERRICEHTVPTLSSIRQDMYAAGYQAAQLLDERMRHPRRKLESVRFGVAELVRRASSSRCGQFDARVLAALEYIRLHAIDGISSADVAAQFSCSRRYLDRIFGESVGHSILDEIQQRKVEAVKDLLKKRQSLKQDAIADLCGFASPEDMRRVFKKVEGRTIGELLDSWKKLGEHPSSSAPVSRIGLRQSKSGMLA
ncbi:MAG: substrate-binding domain-containing protein, partial [bacterium]|nr:substrate-binding domain-containing protein [Candidatus Colisoma equi]